MEEDRVRELREGFHVSCMPLDIEGQQPEEVVDCVLELMGRPADDAPPVVARTGVGVLFLRHGGAGLLAKRLSRPPRDGPVRVRPRRGHGRPSGGRTVRARRGLHLRLRTGARPRCWPPAPADRRSSGRGPARAGFHSVAGKPFEDVRKLLGPAAEDVLTGNSDRCEIPGEETYEDARRRALDFFAELTERHDGQKVLVVGHGGPHSWLVAKALGADLKGVRRLRWDTGHFSRFLLRGNTVSVDFLNRPPDDVARGPDSTSRRPR